MADKKTVGKYTLANIIQYDSLGDVYNAPLDEDQSVWVKLLSVCPKEVKFPESRDLRTKIATQLQEFKHLGIAKLQKLILDKSQFYFIYDSTAGPSLSDALLEKPFTVPQIRQFLIQLFMLLRAAHEQNIFHTKLIPDRICFNEDLTQLKVRELGLRQLLPANYFPKLTPKQKLIEAQFCQFVAPEAVENRYDAAYDVWSVGALAYFMLTRELPYPAATTVQQYLKAAKTSPVFPENFRQNTRLVDLISKMLVFENRPAIAELITHSFIQEENQLYFDKWEQQCAKFLIVRKKRINADGEEEVVEEGAEKEKGEGAEGEEEVEKIDVDAPEVDREKSEEKAEKEEISEENHEAKEEKADEKAQEEQVVEKTEEVKPEDEQHGEEQHGEDEQHGDEQNAE